MISHVIFKTSCSFVADEIALQYTSDKLLLYFKHLQIVLHYFFSNFINVEVVFSGDKKAKFGLKKKAFL